MRHLSLTYFFGMMIVCLVLVAPSAFANEANDPPTRDKQAEQDSTLVELNTRRRIFPLLQKNVPVDRLPLPFGVRVMFSDISSSYGVSRLELGGINMNQLLGVTPSIDIKTRLAGIGFDWFLLPFMNLYTTVGYANLDVDATGRLRGTPIALDLNLKMDAVWANTGVIFAGSIKGFFAMLQLSHMYVGTIVRGGVDVGGMDHGHHFLGDARVGYQWKNIQFWASVQYITRRPPMRGVLDFGGPTPFYAKFTEPPVNASIGFRAEIARNIEIVSDLYYYGYRGFVMSLGYRF